MQLFRTLLCGVLTIVLAGGGSTESSVDRIEKFSETMIAGLFEDALSQDVIEPYSLVALENAEVLDIDLVRQERLSGFQWVVEIEMEADFGLAPAAVIGFERIRRGRYRLILARSDGQLKLRRFTPIAQIESLPASN